MSVERFVERGSRVRHVAQRLRLVRCSDHPGEVLDGLNGVGVGAQIAAEVVRRMFSVKAIRHTDKFSKCFVMARGLAIRLSIIL